MITPRLLFFCIFSTPYVTYPLCYMNNMGSICILSTIPLYNSPSMSGAVRFYLHVCPKAGFAAALYYLPFTVNGLRGNRDPLLGLRGC